LFSFFS
jgi:hypothetical protein